MKAAKVLCIDDSRSIHAFLRECVSSVASEFKSCYDGEEAVAFLSKNIILFDLIFLDWEMPKKNGPEVLREIKKMGVTSKVIMTTSKNKTEDIAQVLSEGASEYMMKPFTKDIVLQKISMVLA